LQHSISGFFLVFCGVFNHGRREMETTAVEVTRLETVINEVRDLDVAQLTDLQLALVGGGIGDVIVG
jgi:hypothetical protein